MRVNQVYGVVWEARDVPREARDLRRRCGCTWGGVYSVSVFRKCKYGPNLSAMLQALTNLFCEHKL